MGKAAVLAVLAFLFLLSCDYEPHGLEVQAKWNKAIRDFDLTPLYPMQEDVMIGDAFLMVPPSPKSKSSDPAGKHNWLVRIGGVNKNDIKDYLAAAYGERLRLAPNPTDDAPDPKTAARPEAAWTAAAAISTPTTTSGRGMPASRVATMPANAATPEPSQGAPGDSVVKSLPVYEVAAVGTRDPLRLHRVALPDLQVARITNDELLGGGIFSGILEQLGFGSSSHVGLDLSLTNVSEIHLPIIDSYDLMLDEMPEFLAKKMSLDFLLTYLSDKRPDLLPAICNADFKSLRRDENRKDTVRLLLANEVVYAGGVNYSFSSGSTYAGRIALSAAAAATAAPEPAAPGPTARATMTAPAAGTGAALPAQLDAQKGGLADGLAALAIPGGSTSIAVGTSGNLTLQHTFTTPMAVGFANGLTYTLTDILFKYHILYQQAVLLECGNTVVHENKCIHKEILYDNESIFNTMYDPSWNRTATGLAEPTALAEPIDPRSPTQTEEEKNKAKELGAFKLSRMKYYLQSVEIGIDYLLSQKRIEHLCIGIPKHPPVRSGPHDLSAFLVGNRITDEDFPYPRRGDVGYRAYQDRDDP